MDKFLNVPMKGKRECSNYVSSFLSSKVFCEERFLQKQNANLNFFTSVAQPAKVKQFWPHASENAAENLSSVFAAFYLQ